jgi:hypothetical protein
VFAKLAPLDKARIIRILRERGHVVGFLGDGINDAAAAYFGWLLLILLAYACLTQVVKTWFVRRYGDS